MRSELWESCSCVFAYLNLQESCQRRPPRTVKTAQGDSTPLDGRPRVVVCYAVSFYVNVRNCYCVPHVVNSVSKVKECDTRTLVRDFILNLTDFANSVVIFELNGRNCFIEEWINRGNVRRPYSILPLHGSCYLMEVHGRNRNSEHPALVQIFEHHLDTCGDAVELLMLGYQWHSQFLWCRCSLADDTARFLNLYRLGQDS